MSLDIYISEKELTKEFCECHCGNVHEHLFHKEIEHFNITHNLAPMASALGICDIVWRPDEKGITECKQLIEPLEKAYETLCKDPDKYKKYEPSNGWGTYLSFQCFLYEYLQICKQFPDAIIEVSR